MNQSDDEDESSGGARNGRTENSGVKHSTFNKASNSGGRNENSSRLKSNQYGERKNTKKLPPRKLATFDTADLLHKKLPNLITFLVENLTDFTEYLAPPLSPNVVVEIVSIIEKICSSEIEAQFSYVILTRIQQNFMKQLERYLIKLSLEEEDDKGNNEKFWVNPEAFWGSLLEICENIVEKFQKGATQFLPKVIKACLITITSHKNSQGVCVKESITQKFEFLNKRLKNLRKISEQGTEECDDDYQTIHICPDPNEVLIQKKPYLRQNIIDGSYNSVEHYLDTHFRLLREDFLAPLRKAVSTYKDSLKNKEYVKISEFRVYPGTEFVYTTLDYDSDSERGPSFAQKVRRKMYKSIKPGECNQNYVSDDKFMYGTLLCFSSDNFETMFFAMTVKLYGTEKGLVDVHLLESIPFLYSKKYTMLECTNYFGTYHLVLRALQNFDINNFPMEKYFINVSNETEPPGYVTPTTNFLINHSRLTLLDFESWPSKEKLNLNEMQYYAFKHAPTSKCAIIQGPPGTGKTHLGLKIAQTLIQNRDVWQVCHNFSDLTSKDKQHANDIKIETLLGRRLYKATSTMDSPGPILIVAYTNHALDQFLENLIPYTEKIIRIGQQCKNELINPFIFGGLRYDRSILTNFYRHINDALETNENIIKELENLLTYGGIFDFKKLASVIPDLRNSQLYNLENDEIISWLLGKFSTEQEREERWNITKDILNDFECAVTNLGPHQSYYHRSDYILTISSLTRIANELENKRAFRDDVDIEAMFENWHTIEEQSEQTKDNLAYLQWRLRYPEQHANLYASKCISRDNPFELPYNDRWILYFHWLDCYVQHLKEALKRNNLTIQQLWEELDKFKQTEDSVHIRSKAVVVGMTTSGAARNRHLLEQLKCRIVIVEEAAEVLESHIVVSLTSHCQHLILIGDHQQLRPSTADYQIEKQYQLGISLFERMVRNGISYSTLGVQHRMQPEISRLIVPAIYPHLENHSSVYDFPKIAGIKHNVFFINHAHAEVEIGNSRKNPHEAAYLLALARHLILQGNDPSEITILTTYKGQMYEIENEQKKNTFAPLKNVRVSVVDNFQGEENQIILLSLVRSNNQGSIGFLAIENRVCVALSRAKKGFYMIGNLDVLSENSKIWPKVREVLENNQQVGAGLQLTCQAHPQNVTVAERSSNFLNVPDGGCHLPCNANLQCKHVCQRKCHVTDVDHTDYHCMEPCTKIVCKENHKCSKRCWEYCGICEFPVEHLLPCEHQQMIPCSMEIKEYTCPVLVERVLKCGHTVDMPCFENEAKFRCLVEVEVKRTCQHIAKSKCYQCNLKPCEAIITIALKCGHNKETECCRRYFSGNCKEPCLKPLKCGHICHNQCHYYRSNECVCKETCTKLKIGCKTDHKCNILCSEPCLPCHEEVTINLPCGHSKVVSCRKFDEKHSCDNLCKKVKPCGHFCYSKCHPAICESECLFQVMKIMPDCGHRVKVNCSENPVGKACVRCLKKNFSKVNIQDKTEK